MWLTQCITNKNSSFSSIDFGIISGRQIPDYECSFVYNSSFETSGWFHSPNFPGAYPRYYLQYHLSPNKFITSFLLGISNVTTTSMVEQWREFLFVSHTLTWKEYFRNFFNNYTFTSTLNYLSVSLGAMRTHLVIQ